MTNTSKVNKILDTVIDELKNGSLECFEILRDIAKTKSLDPTVRVRAAKYYLEMAQKFSQDVASGKVQENSEMLETYSPDRVDQMADYFGWSEQKRHILQQDDEGGTSVA